MPHGSCVLASSLSLVFVALKRLNLDIGNGPWSDDDVSPVSGGHLDKSQVRRTGAQNLASRIRQIAPLLRPHVGDIVLIAVLLLVASGLGMFLPILTGRIIDALPTGNIRIIVLLVAIQLVVGLVQAAVGYVQNRVSSAFSLGLGTELRIALASKLQRAHLGRFISRPKGEITNRLDGDVQSVVSSILGISPSFVAACGLLWMLVVLPLLNWRLAIVACAFIPLWFIALLPAGPVFQDLPNPLVRRATDWTPQYQKRLDFAKSCAQKVSSPMPKT